MNKGSVFDVGKAHQRKIREERSLNAAQENLFGAWWEDIDTDIKKAEVREISYATAEAIILEYEWLGCMPAMVEVCYGIFWGDACGGVAVMELNILKTLGHGISMDTLEKSFCSPVVLAPTGRTLTLEAN